MVAPTLQAAILKALADVGPMTERELSLMLDRSTSTTASSLRGLYRHGRIFVHSWQPTIGKGGRRARVWAEGPGADVPEPPRDSLNVRSRRSYQKHKLKIRLKDNIRRGRETSMWSGLIKKD